MKKTLLYQWHTSHKANMAEFGGYKMPLWYLSAKNEHLAVLTNAGMFDTSHMASIMVKGKDAFNLLQHCFTNDINACIGKDNKPLFSGRCVYGAFLNDQGYVIDDAIIFQIDENDYMVVVNAGMGGIIVNHFAANKGSRNVDIKDMTDNLGKMDIQGPESAKIMAKILDDSNKVFDKMPYFSFKGHFDKNSPLSDDVRLKDGTCILLARTGYTGEFGFEIFTAPENFIKVWEMIMSAGKNFGLTACGLAARDSLRAGAVLPLSHQDIGNWVFINNPWSFSLPFNNQKTGFTKEFIGCKALLNLKNPEFTYAFAGNDLRKVSLPSVVLDSDNQEEIGIVLTCATDMAISRHKDIIYSIASPDKPKEFKPKGLSCGFVKVNKKLKTGHVLTLKDSRRKIQVKIENNIRPDRTARKALKYML